MLGAGLLLFRLVIGGVTMSFALRWIAGSAERTTYVWTIGVISVICGVLLVVGFMTLVAGVLASFSVVAMSVATEAFVSSVFSASALNVLTAILALGIALTGPGAFSIEGHLYGRREIVVPPSEENG